MGRILLRDVSVSYRLLTVHDYNLKRRVVDAARRRAESARVIEALSSVDLDLADGARLGLVGVNGSGKSTLLSVMAGLLPPSSGQVTIEGRVLALLGGAATGLDQEASGRANILAMGVQLGETPTAMRGRIEDIVEFSGLGGRIDDAVHSYSTGMQARLRFSILTSLRPDVLLIDEGIATADAEFAQRAGSRLRDFTDAAGIVVLASHGEELLRQHCDRGIWLHRGVAMRTDSIGKVLDSYHEFVGAGAPLASG